MSSLCPPAGVSAIVTAYRRVDQTLSTLDRILGCTPPPAEVLVHVDGAERACADAVRNAFPSVRVILSQDNIGPGGGRNKLVEAASTPLVASFDDDSYPLDVDYFSRVASLFAEYPDAAVLAAKIFERGTSQDGLGSAVGWVADFVGCGSAYRRSSYLEVGGYVPIPIAYGMEEVDLAIRLHARGAKVLYAESLRVFHDTSLERHANPMITAYSIANPALLAFLRYPPSLWPLGGAQVANRIRWLLTHGRGTGILRGLLSIPFHCWRYRAHRNPLPRSAVRSYLSLRQARSTLTTA